MSVRCSKCGEELLGAVNRCWKCGQTFALRPEIDGRPPVRPGTIAASELPLVAMVVEQDESTQASAASVSVFNDSSTAPSYSSSIPIAIPRFVQPRGASTSEMIEARRNSMMAMGGTVASLVLGLLSIGLTLLWPPTAVIAMLGLVMGIWGLYSPRRNLALVGMLLCCLSIGLGAYGLARATHQWVVEQRPIVIEDAADPAVPEP